jgi:hypothetical protein
MITRFDISAIAEALRARAAEVAIALLGEPNRPALGQARIFETEPPNTLVAS